MSAADTATDMAAIDSPPKVFKFLVVADDTPECHNAVRFGARRAARAHGGGLVMLYITHPPDFQHWSTVADVMREEAETEARSVLFGLATEVQTECGIEPELVIREGKPTEVVLNLLKEDPNIRILVLATGTGSEGPGPLVSSFSGKLLPHLTIPVTLVPGHLAIEDIDAIT